MIIAVFAEAWFLVTRTVYGQQLFAIGGKPEAARLSAIAVRRVVRSWAPFAVLSHGMTLMNVESFYQQIIMVAVILAAVFIDHLLRHGFAAEWAAGT